MFSLDIFFRFGLMTISWECNNIVYIKSHDNWFQITVRLCYHACLIIFVIAQTLWIYFANRYHAKIDSKLGRCINWFTFRLVIALNLVIYVKTTLNEAKQSFHELAENAGKTSKQKL